MSAPIEKIFIKGSGQSTPLQPMVNFTSPDRPLTPSFIGDFVADPSELTPAENGICPQPTLQSDRHQRTVAREGGARRAHQPQAQRVLFPDDSEYLLESYHRSLQGDLLAFPVAFGKRLLAMIDDPDSWVPEEDKPYVRRLARALVYGAPPRSGPGNFPHSDVEVRCAIAMMLMGAATGQIPKNNEALVAMFHEKFPGLHLTAKTVLNRIRAMTEGGGFKLTLTDIKNICGEHWFQERVREWLKPPFRCDSGYLWEADGELISNPNGHAIHEWIFLS